VAVLLSSLLPTVWDARWASGRPGLFPVRDLC